MTKPKTWPDLARSLEADWPPLTDLVAEAVDWDFTHWCYVSSYDAADPDAVTEGNSGGTADGIR